MFSVADPAATTRDRIPVRDFAIVRLLTGAARDDDLSMSGSTNMTDGKRDDAAQTRHGDNLSMAEVR